MQKITEKQHIDYHFRALEDSEAENGDPDENYENDDDESDDDNYEDHTDGELSFDHRQNDQDQNMFFASQHSMEVTT